MHHPLRRTLPALAALGIAVGAPVLTAGTAHAVMHDCGEVAVQYSVDGGSHWINGGRMSEPHGTIQVRLVGETSPGCDYKVSLASYSTEGPDWGTSGTQTFLGWATTTLNHDRPQATLDVSAHLPKCFGQIDLYAGDQKFDGVSNPAPHFPDTVVPRNLITAWNGGSACQPTPSSSPSAPVSPNPVPPSHPAGSPSPSASVPPSASPKPSHSPSTPTRTGHPSSAPSAPAPSASEPVGTPSVKPVSDKPAPVLASTGSDGGQMIATAVGGVALLALGAGAVVFSRRRAARR
ncbi:MULTISPECIES: LPXTG cell wall anchor domain-containing protein [Kitasatospora]|uniref:Gram-positive cocci surface proteins LPxTG domain-containing protein n=1 Tax=Kitasatospora cystarginea TaxID=58350 RepID=A0ABN3EZZ6_9ACTN